MAMTGGTARLVKTTYPFSDKSKAVNLYIYYRVAKDIEANQSVINCGMYVTTPSGWDIGQWDDWNAASYVGTTSNTFDGTIPNFSGTRWIAENKRFTVDHNPDGTGTATIYWKWAVNSPWGGYENPSGSFTIDLPKIERTSSITLSPTSVTVGNPVTITINRVSSSFTHNVYYSINGVQRPIVSGIGTSFTWSNTKVAIAPYITDSTSAVVTITCETIFNGSVIGRSTATVTFNMPGASGLAVSAASVRMGESITISVNSPVDTYTHKLKYTLNGETKEFATKVQGSYTWNVPDLMHLIPNAKYGTATITCNTYNGLAPITTQSVQVKIYAYAPSVPSMTNPVKMGDEYTITVWRNSDLYTHTLKYRMGTKQGVIATNVGYYHSWKIPESLVTEVVDDTSGILTIQCTTFNGTAVIGDEEIDVKLQVPDASIPTIVGVGGVMDEVLTINISSKASQYTHEISYKFEGESGDIDHNNESVLSWRIPLELAKATPYNTSGIMTIYCITYNGTEVVGSNSCSFTVTVPDNEITKPVLSASLRSVNELPSKFASLYLLGKSRVGVTFNANSEYSEVSRYKARVGNISKESTSPYIELELPLSGTLGVEITVTDARGYSRTIVEDITVIPYDIPRLVSHSSESSIICSRCTAGSETVSPHGESVLIKAKASFSKVEGLNSCSVYYRYTQSSKSDYDNDWVLFDSGLSDITDVSHVTGAVFAVEYAYTFQLKIVDEVGEDKVYTYAIPFFSIPFNLGQGGRNLGLGQFCDYSEVDRIDIGWKTYFNTGIGKKVIFDALDDVNGWDGTEDLSAAYPDSDSPSVLKYSLFVAVLCSPTSVYGREIIPVICAKLNNKIYGGYESVSVQMEYDSRETMQTLKLKSITDGYTVNALYALL